MSGKSGWCIENRHHACAYRECSCSCHKQTVERLLDHGAWAAVEAIFATAEQTMRETRNGTQKTN